MSETNQICKRCGVKLGGKNWNPSSMKNNTMVCKQCNQYASIENTRKHGVKPASENKKCSLFLGCHVAETLLSKVFKNVQRMPNGNPGYDFICNRNYMVDVKSSATGDNDGRWSFHITKNIVADYFLCLAFDNRDDLNPIYLWLMPSDVINHFVTLVIRKSDIYKWKQYELQIDDVISCCDKMK